MSTKTPEEIQTELAAALRQSLRPMLGRERMTEEFLGKVAGAVRKVLAEFRESEKLVPLVKIRTEPRGDHVCVTLSSDDPETAAWLESLNPRIDLP